MSESNVTSMELSRITAKRLEEEAAKDYPSLGNQRKLFAYYYIRDFDHVAAAVEAGFSGSSGIRLIREPVLSHFIESLKKEMFTRLQIDADMVKTWWLETLPILSGKSEAPRMLKDGTSIEAKHFDAPSLVAALKELGKMTDIYKDGSGNGETNIVINMGDLGLSGEDAQGITIEGTYSSGDDDGAPV